MPEFVGAIDQGTTSTRFMIFDHDGTMVGAHHLAHEQLLPRAGWLEHDPSEIWRCTETVIEVALDRAGLTAQDLAAVRVTNQRETTVVSDPVTGRPHHNAIVWQDTHTDAIAAGLQRDGRGEVIRRRSGLPPAAYFSGGTALGAAYAASLATGFWSGIHDHKRTGMSPGGGSRRGSSSSGPDGYRQWRKAVERTPD